ncbi:hypothetical protein HYQ46_002499 [Verticillium longisporum]|nr:hypothetical protein HYQ46_002499 [Verticillium longisporum]
MQPSVLRIASTCIHQDDQNFSASDLSRSSSRALVLVLDTSAIAGAEFLGALTALVGIRVEHQLKHLVCLAFAQCRFIGVLVIAIKVNSHVCCHALQSLHVVWVEEISTVRAKQTQTQNGAQNVNIRLAAEGPLARFSIGR